MSFLSFHKGRNRNAFPIAVVRGGKADGKLLYYHENHTAGGELPDDIEYLVEDRPMRREEFENDKTQIVRLPADSEFEIYPRNDKRACYYVYAKSGAGKSSISSQIAENYLDGCKGKIGLISKKGHDPVLDKLPCKRLDVGELIEDPITDLNEIANSLIIADDVDTFKGDEEKAVFHLLDDIVALGRQPNISLIFATHKNSDGRKTSLIINEATHFVIFPKYATPQALEYLLVDKLGLKQNLIKKMIAESDKTHHNWYCIHTEVPAYYISKHECRII